MHKMKKMETGLTFDDVLLVPQHSRVLPYEVNISSNLTNSIKLKIPILSAAMDTVTEHATAIAMARNGGIGVIHKNLSPFEQAKQVARVKRSEFYIVTKPFVISPKMKVGEVLELRKNVGISTFPVIHKGKLVGIVTKRDLRFEEDMKKEISKVMTRDLITVKGKINWTEAKNIMHKHRIEKIPILSKNGKLKGLITSTDIEKNRKYPNAIKDKKGRLVVAAAVGTNDFERARLLVEEDIDVLVVDTSHGHSQKVIDTVRRLKKMFDVQVIAGNIATGSAAKALINAGADAVKVGIGSGSICTTRIVTGVGVPQVTAIKNVAKTVKKKIPVIADGGVRYSGDIVKAIAVGADTVMIGSIFAGCDETPGKTVYLNHRKFKQYRGMGSINAMKLGSSNRYFQDQTEKFVPEGIEGLVPYKGSLKEVLHQLTGGLRSGMGLVGAKNIRELQKAKMIKITNAGVIESHPHNIKITEEAPNYP